VRQIASLEDNYLSGLKELSIKRSSSGLNRHRAPIRQGVILQTFNAENARNSALELVINTGEASSDC